jgi:ubiquinone/menaquinone biosynthesis C-methylase UbiE
MPVTLDPEERETDVIHALIDFSGKDVLEIGCGDGRMTWRYAARTRSVLGLDPVVASIDQARADTPADLRATARFEVGDITSVALPTAAFDVVALSWSLC